MDRRNNFDLLRLFAACQVVFMHSSGHLLLPKAGLFEVLLQFPGVAVFFVISGFLVSDSYLRSTSVTSFAWKRAVRIYPALIVNLLVLELVFGATGGISTTAWAYAKHLIVYLPTASIHFAGTVFPDAIYAQSWLFQGYPSGVLWTLTVELSFYVVLPFVLSLAAVSKKAGSLFIAILMIGSFSIAHVTDDAFSQAHPALNELVTPYFWIFGIGVLIRLWWEHISRWFEGRALFWLAGYLFLIVVSVVALGEPIKLEYKMEPNIITLVRVVVMGATVISLAYTAKSCATLLHGNDLSYGLYLWHMLGVSVFLGLGIKGHWWLYPACYGIGLSFAAASWFLIEKPALALKQSKMRRFAAIVPVLDEVK
ncbi:Peptidoglycan/LPS O-acetylase OafA/YrhL, contains acyltransferase and SGNH-hydrolase domains [Bradyrhizobium arachidis]|nr:Peptidoglycan/LPS O-acetylase OafA/YrhL, contains acyltransferase and SGNH-hydrolase domains [Bradyrhizobium arachidis]